MIYDRKFFWKLMAILVALIAVLMATGGTGFVVVLPFAFAAFFQRKPEMMLFWVMVSMTVIVGNSYFMPKDAILMLAQRVMVLSFGLLMFVQVSVRRKAPSVAPFLLLYPYLLYIFVPSVMGWSPLISLLKLVLFIVVYMAFLGIANETAQSSRAAFPRLRAMVLVVASFFIVGSVCLLPFPAIGQMSSQAYVDALARGQEVKSLFMGMTSHSQSLGGMMAILCVFVFADWALAVRRASAIHALLLFLGVILLYKTSSRTAMGSLLMGCAAVEVCLARERGLGARWRTKVKKAVWGLLVVGVVAVVAVPTVRNRIVGYAMKWSPDAVASEFNIADAVSTRQGLVERQMVNFRKKPLFGNGFQVSEEMAGFKSRSWKDLLSAPVEKGVWVTAVLEEGGVVGLVLFLTFIAVAGTQLLVRRAHMSLALLVVMLTQNLGEFSIFSLSSSGGFNWLLTFVATIFDAFRLRDEQKGVFRMARPIASWNGQGNGPVQPLRGVV